jgi:hypothetical protein
VSSADTTGKRLASRRCTTLEFVATSTPADGQRYEIRAREVEVVGQVELLVFQFLAMMHQATVLQKIQRKIRAMSTATGCRRLVSDRPESCPTPLAGRR